MAHKLVRVALALGGMLALCPTGRAAADSAARAMQPPKLLRLSVGETTAVAGLTGAYERVLVMPPDGETAATGNTWEVGADVAVRLARLPERERWRAIRRNLGLAPEDRDDLILWREVADAAFDSLAKLALAQEPAGQGFGLQVAFPGTDTTDPPAQAALLFPTGQTTRRPGEPADPERDLKSGIADAMTGVEGFVEFAAGGGAVPPLSALDELQVQLLGSDQQPVAVAPVVQGYFCFPRLTADPDFGSDYYLVVTRKGSLSALAATPLYVPVMRGIRSRVQLTVPRPAEVSIMGEKGFSTSDWSVSGGSAALLLQQFVEGSSLLGAITQRLPANPGLHLGVVRTADIGPTTLWSARFLLRQPAYDRRPRFVTRGKLRLQCLTVAATPSAARRHYVKMTWFAQAAPLDLKLTSRRVPETPWGIGVGVAPSADPALYAVGLSYKLLPTAELLAGVGYQQDHSGALLYALTFDVDPILNGLFGRKREGK